MASTRASISKVSKRPKINIIPPKQLFVDLTQDDTKTPSPKLPNSSPSAPNAPSKTPSTKDTSSSSIDYIPKSPTSSTSPSPNGYLNPSTSPPPRVSPPPPTQDNASMDITLTLSPNTPLDVQFDTPSPSPPIIAHPIPWNFLEAHGLWYSRDSPFKLVAYTDSDYAEATLDRKSTTGGCQFLGNRLISWQCKKQTVVATSTTEAEYVATASCCGQVLWIQNQLIDYGYNFMNTVINIDNNNLLTKVMVQADFNTWDQNMSRHIKRGQDTKIPQSSGPPEKVGDEVVHKELGDRMERAATTASSLEVEQDSGSGPRCQDTILGDVNAQTRFEITSKQSIDPRLLRNYTLRSGEDNRENLCVLDEAVKETSSCIEVSSVLLKEKSKDKEQQKESLKKQKVEEEKVLRMTKIELKRSFLIVDYKLHKEGMLVHYQLIRADGSSKRYSSMIRMLQGIDREDLEALWRIVKAKYGDTRPENEFERVLYGDLKVMFEPDIKSDIWRMLQGYRATIWKLIDSSRVHFVSAAGEKVYAAGLQLLEDFLLSRG
ncbi:hypothetical protein Tco_0127682 [Tanacetum coccineum]